MASFDYNNNDLSLGGDMEYLPRSHKFLLKLGNLIQVKNSKTCSSISLASGVSSVEDGISVNSLDDSLKRFTNKSHNSSKNRSHQNMAHREVDEKGQPNPHTTTLFNFGNNVNKGNSKPIDNATAPACSMSSETANRRHSNPASSFLSMANHSLLFGPNTDLYGNHKNSIPQLLIDHQLSLFNASSYHNLKIPPCIAEAASNEILETSKNEPFGLRGCVVRVRLTLTGGTLQGVESAPKSASIAGANTYVLGHVICDPDTVTTFHIELILHEDEQRFLTKLKYMLPPKLARRAPIIVSPRYTLKKVRLFRVSENDTTSAEE